LASWFTTTPATGAVANSGAASTAAGAPNNWGCYISANVPVVGIRTGTYAIDLPTTGYYDVYTTWAATTSGKTNAKFFTTAAGGVTATSYLVQNTAASAHQWASLGSALYNAHDTANTKVTLTNDNQTASGSLYLHSVKYASSVSDAVSYVTGSGIQIDLSQWNEFSWNAGAKTSFFNIYLGETSGALNLVAGGLGIGANTMDMGDPTLGLQGGKTYYWRVDDGNIDNVTAGAEMMFTTKPVPEPSSMLAFATGFIGLFGIIRRKKA